MASDDTVLQEVHGSPEEFWSAFGHYDATHFVYFSAGLQYDAGGTATFCKKSYFHQSCTFCSEEVVPGRISVTTVDLCLANGARTLDIFNIHNHDLVQWHAKIKSWVEPCLQRANDGPDEYTCIFAGDFNHFAAEDLSLDVANAELTTSAVSSVHSPGLWRYC